MEASRSAFSAMRVFYQRDSEALKERGLVGDDEILMKECLKVVYGSFNQGLSIDFDEAFVNVAQSFARAAGQNGAGDI